MGLRLLRRNRGVMPCGELLERHHTRQLSQPWFSSVHELDGDVQLRLIAAMGWGLGFHR